MFLALLFIAFGKIEYLYRISTILQLCCSLNEYNLRILSKEFLAEFKKMVRYIWTQQMGININSIETDLM